MSHEKKRSILSSTIFSDCRSGLRVCMTSLLVCIHLSQLQEKIARILVGSSPAAPALLQWQSLPRHRESRRLPDPACETVSLSIFPVFVPSLSWQIFGRSSIKWHRKNVSTPCQRTVWPQNIARSADKVTTISDDNRAWLDKCTCGNIFFQHVFPMS